MPKSSLDKPLSTDIQASTKGIFRSLADGIKTLIVLEEKLSVLGKEEERTRVEVKCLIENLSRLVGYAAEADKRTSDRFSSIDKRFDDINKIIDLKIELAVRDRLDKLFGDQSYAKLAQGVDIRQPLNSEHNTINRDSK